MPDSATLGGRCRVGVGNMMASMWACRFRGVCSPLIAFTAIVLTVLAAPAAADDVLQSGMSWMTAYPSTWNAGAPKVVSDGLHSYAALCGYDGSQYTCSVARRRGTEAWTRGSFTFSSHQPAVVVIDRKGRLNIFYNFPGLYHVRIDHPSVDLQNVVPVPVSFGGNAGYLHASYDSATDTVSMAFNDTVSWATYFSSRTGDGAWTAPSPMPAPDAASMYLYVRTIKARGRYFVLGGQHPRNGINAAYTGAVLWESTSPTGPWSTRILHRSTGNNIGVFYQNMSFPVDLQADAAGNVRALMHINEDGSGHPGVAEGLHIAREEDGYALRHVGRGIDDGFPLYVDPSGVHFAFALIINNPGLYAQAGKLVAFRSADNGATWGPAQPLVGSAATNPVTIDTRNGSMLGGNDLAFIYTHSNTPPFERVSSSTFALGVTDSADRYDYTYTEADGTVDYVRAYRDPAGNRSYYYIQDNETDGSFTLSYSYTAGAYYQVYIGKSNGSYRFYNSDGYAVEHVVAAVENYGYWYADDDGTQDYIQVYKDPAQAVLWWIIYDYAPGGGWTYTYVYYRGSYWYIDITSSDGHYNRSDSAGYRATG
jgi:hypothetical protein